MVGCYVLPESWTPCPLPFDVVVDAHVLSTAPGELSELGFLKIRNHAPNTQMGARESLFCLARAPSMGLSRHRVLGRARGGREPHPYLVLGIRALSREPSSASTPGSAALEWAREEPGRSATQRRPGALPTAIPPRIHPRTRCGAPTNPRAGSELGGVAALRMTVQLAVPGALGTRRGDAWPGGTLGWVARRRYCAQLAKREQPQGRYDEGACGPLGSRGLPTCRAAGSGPRAPGPCVATSGRRGRSLVRCSLHTRRAALTPSLA